MGNGSTCIATEGYFYLQFGLLLNTQQWRSILRNRL